MKTVLGFINHLTTDSLYKNSMFLILSTFVMGTFGFFFWILSARLFTPTQVGIATALLSVTTLISTFSLLGLGNSLIKYLPGSERKNEKINTVFTLVCITTLIVTLLFLAIVDYASPSIAYIRQNILLSILFIIFTLFASLNLVSDNIFIAYRSTKYVLIKSIILSLTKLVLPVMLVSAGAYGIYMSVGIATTVAVSLCLIFLIIRFNYLPRPIINKEVVKRMTKFSLENYAAGFLGLMPALVLPIIIINALGAQFSAYFYIDMMIANFLFIIPMAISQSLFAEGSYSEVQLKIQLKKAIVVIFLLMVPSILLMLLLGKYILLAFGQDYSSEGITLLHLLAISGVFLSINYVGNAVFYIKHKMRLVLLVNLLGTFLILFLSFVFANNLTDLGIYWVIGQGTISILYVLFIKKAFQVN